MTICLECESFAFSKERAKTNICVVHHAPGYNINYAADKYDFLWDKVKENKCDIDNEFREIIKLLDARKIIPKEQMMLIKEISKDDALYDNLLRYCEKCEQREDDYVSSFISELKEDIELSNLDKENYNNQLIDLNKKLNFDYILAGHEHSLRQYDDQGLKANIGDLFYKNDKDKLHYAILRQSTDFEKFKGAGELIVENV